jgi:MFS family permease
MRVSVVVGFAFVVGYYGLPFVMSLYLQQLRGLSPLATGMVFLPMTVTGAVLTPLSARLAERFGARSVITSGLVLLAAGLVALAVVTTTTPIAAIAVAMMLPGVAGPSRRSPPCCSTASATTKPAPRAACSTPAARSAAHSPSPCSAHCSAPEAP